MAVRTKSGGQDKSQPSMRRAYVQVTPGSCLDQTAAAICEASQYPLSILMIGVRILHLKQ